MSIEDDIKSIRNARAVIWESRDVSADAIRREYIATLEKAMDLKAILDRLDSGEHVTFLARPNPVPQSEPA